MWFIRRCKRGIVDPETGWGLFFKGNNGITIITHWNRNYRLIKPIFKSFRRDSSVDPSYFENWVVGGSKWHNRGYKFL